MTASPSDFTEIRLEVDSSIATLTLDRPDRLNAFTTTMMHELLSAFDAIDADDGIRAVIMTGAGRGFCAGADLAAGGETFAPRRDDGAGDGADDGAGDGAGGDQVDEQRVHRDGGGRVALRIFECTKPVIAAINGAAVGVGVTMTLPADVRIASSAARFGFVFARRGIVPEACSSWFLPRLVGISQAVEWCYSGRVFDAEEALAGGLVRSVYAPDALMDSARELAQSLVAESAPVSVAMTRQMLWRMLGAAHPMDAHRVDSRAIAHRGASGDAREGVMSFLDKRAAVFPDRVSDGLPEVFEGWETPEFS